MALVWADVRSEHIQRQEKARAALNGLTIARVIAVRRPDTVGMRQYPEISASAAGCTAFNFDIGMGGADPVDQIIERLHLSMGLRIAAGITRMVQVAVHVPFDVADSMVTQHRVDLGEQIVGDLSPGNVEHILIPERHLIDA